MKKSFSDDMLSTIHIKLDKQGLEGVSEKELLVLIDDKLEDSTQRVCAQIEDSTAPILTEVQGVRLEVKEMHSEMQEMHTEVKGMRAEIHAELQGMRADMQETRTEVQGMHFEVKEMHLDLRNLNFWAKMLVGGTWAVAASLIASLIFRACGM